MRAFRRCAATVGLPVLALVVSVVVPVLAARPAAAASAWPVGVICSCTGPESSSTSTSAPTLDAWADEVNAKGGINGHMVNLIVKDDDTNPATASSEAQELVTQNHVLAIFDDSDVDSAFAPYVTQHHVPVVGSFADSHEMYTNADFFPNGATINWAPADIVYLARHLHAKKLSDLYCAEVPICKQFVKADKVAASKAGLEVTDTAPISVAAPTYTAQCLAAKESGATAMTVGDASGIVIKVAEDCAQQGYKPTQLNVDGTVGESWRTTPALDGNVDVQPDVPFFVQSTPATAEMMGAIKKYQPSLASSPDFGEVVPEAWTSGLLLEAAARAAHLGDDPTRVQVMNGLYDLHGDTLGGMAPPLTYKRGKPTTDINCVFLMGIKNGQWTLPMGLKQVCPT